MLSVLCHGWEQEWAMFTFKMVVRRNLQYWYQHQKLDSFLTYTNCCYWHCSFNPPGCKASREVANLTEIKICILTVVSALLLMMSVHFFKSSTPLLAGLALQYCYNHSVPIHFFISTKLFSPVSTDWTMSSKEGELISGHTFFLIFWILSFNSACYKVT